MCCPSQLSISLIEVTSKYAAMAELVDATDLKSVEW